MLIGIFTVLVHGLMLLNDGVFFDGWLIYWRMIDGHLEHTRETFYEAGLPLFWVLHRMLGASGTVFGYRLWCFAAYFITGAALNGTLRLTDSFTRRERLIFVAVALCYPGFFQGGGELILVPYAVLFAVFMLGCWAAIASVVRTGGIAGVLRVTALFAFAISFSIKSLLVFYGGLVTLLIVVRGRQLGLQRVRDLIRLAPRFADFLVLPPLFWIATSRLFPTYGAYASYNAIRLAPKEIAVAFANFVYNALYALPNEALGTLLAAPLVPALCLLFLWYHHDRVAPSTDGPSEIRKLALATAVLMFLAAFPYAAVARFPTVHGWNTRHALLFGVPFGLLIVTAARALAAGRSPFAATAVATVTVLAFSSVVLNTNLALIARWAKDRSIIAKLQQMSAAKPYSVYWIHDEFPVGGEPDYRFFEWSSIFKSAYGDETRVGFDARAVTPTYVDQSRPLFNARYNLSALDLDGCAATLTISRGPRAGTESSMGLRYLLYRYALKSQLADYLGELTGLDVQPLPAQKDSHCAQVTPDPADPAVHADPRRPM